MALSSHLAIWKTLPLIAFLLTGLVALCFYFREIFLTLLIGHVIVVVADRLITDYRARIARLRFSGWKRRLYGPLTLAFWLVAVVFLLWTSLSDLSQALTRIDTEQLSLRTVYVAKVQPYLPRLVVERVLTPQMVQAGEDYILSLVNVFIQDLSFFLSVGVLIIPLQAGLYFKRRGTLMQRALGGIPSELRDAVQRAAKAMAGDADDFFTGRIIESVAVGSLCCLGFFVAGVKGWMLFGALAGVLNIVPYLGPILSAVPPLMITLLLDVPIAAAYVVITILATQLIDQYYLEPFMVSRRARVHPLLGVILPLAGAKLSGIMGMIFAIPIYSVYKIILREAYEELTRVHGGS
jgi:predicted PurR-regulated permease PerM